MYKALIIILLADLSAIIASVICFCLPNIGSYWIIPIIVFLALTVSELIIFANYTNKFHDINSKETIIGSQNSLSNITNIEIIKNNDGTIKVGIGDGVNLYLKNYPCKKAFVTAFIVRLIYYNEFAKKNKAKDFFKRHKLNNLNQIENLSLIFTYKKNYSKKVIKTHKVKFGFIVEFILESKFLEFLMINQHFSEGFKNSLVTYSEEWFLGLKN